MGELQFAKARAHVITLLSQDLVLESREQIKELIKINKLGFLTIDSQPGTVTYVKQPSDRELFARLWKRYNDRYWRSIERDIGGQFDLAYKDAVLGPVKAAYLRQGGIYRKGIQEKQRAYVTGFMPLENAQAFCDILNQQNYLVAWFTSYSGKRIQTDCQRFGNMTVGVTFGTVTQEGRWSPYDAYPLVYLTEQNNQVHGISEITKISPKYNRKFALVRVLDSRFGYHVRRPQGLFKRVIDALETLSMVT